MSLPKDLTPATCTICDDDVHVTANMALLYSDKAPLPLAADIKTARSKPQISTTDDYKAVWSFTPQPPDPSLLVFFHGNHHYVTVDLLTAPPAVAPKWAKRKPPPPPSRVPDWVDERGWNTGPNVDKQNPKYNTVHVAAPLFYQLEQLAGNQDNQSWPADLGVIKKPVVLVPEDVELLSQSANDWAAPPLYQYAAPPALGDLIEDCYRHLRCTRDAPDSFQPYLKPADPNGPSFVKNLKRVYLCGHSGGGKPMRDCTTSTFALNASLPVDFWLLDATYGLGKAVPDVSAAYIEFCDFWNRQGLLGIGPSKTRFVCVYRPRDDNSNTETIAVDLRNRLAQKLSTKTERIKADDLLVQHKEGNMSQKLIQALKTQKILFIRTDVGHESIPTTFIPMLLRTAAS